jgi:hypothetical protein
MILIQKTNKNIGLSKRILLINSIVKKAWRKERNGKMKMTQLRWSKLIKKKNLKQKIWEHSDLMKINFQS